MKNPKFILQLNNNAKKLKENLWMRNRVALHESENSSLDNIFQIAFTFTFLILAIGIFLLIREYVIGDHTIYGLSRIGAICRDGWHSYSTGQGTCSHHGGVDYWLYPEIGTHYVNPTPYWITITSAVSSIILLSFLSPSFRPLFYACLAEIAYGFAFCIYVILFVVAIPFYIVYTIVISFIQLLYK